MSLTVATHFVWTDWLTAVGTVGATLVALFFGGREIWFRPKLEAELRIGGDECLELTGEVKIPDVGAAPAQNRMLFLRVLMTNKGRATAARARMAVLRVELWNDELSAWQHTATVLDVEGRDLIWANTFPPAAERDLAAGATRKINLVAIPRERPIKGGRPMHVQVSERPLSEADALWGPNAWRFTLETSAERTRARIVYLTIDYDGGWTKPGESFWDIVHINGPSTTPQSQPPRRDRPVGGFAVGSN